MGDRDEFQRLADGFGDVLDVPFVVFGNQDGPDTRTMRGDRLLLQSPDGQNTAAECDLSGHGQVVADRVAGHRRGQRRRKRNTGGGTVFGDGACRDMDMDVAFLGLARIQLKGGRTAHDVSQRRLGGFFHDVAQLTRQDQFARPRHDVDLDHQGIPACPGPCQTRSDANLVFLVRHVVEIARLAHQVCQILRGDPDGFLPTFGLSDLDGGAAAEPGDLPLQLTDARLLGVTLDQQCHGFS